VAHSVGRELFVCYLTMGFQSNTLGFVCPPVIIDGRVRSLTFLSTKTSAACRSTRVLSSARERSVSTLTGVAEDLSRAR